MKTIVERIGKEEGYGLIVDSAALAVLYIDPDFDLTDEVLAGPGPGRGVSGRFGLTGCRRRRRNLPSHCQLRFLAPRR